MTSNDNTYLFNLVLACFLISLVFTQCKPESTKVDPTAIAQENKANHSNDQKNLDPALNSKNSTDEKARFDRVFSEKEAEMKAKRDKQEREKRKAATKKEEERKLRERQAREKAAEQKKKEPVIAVPKPAEKKVTTPTKVTPKPAVTKKPVPPAVIEDKVMKFKGTSEIVFKRNFFDFGEVPSGEVVNAVFNFTNIGNTPLVIENVTATCGCTVPEYPLEPISPNQSADIKVRFDTKGKSGRQQPIITVFANTDPAVHKLYLDGELTEELKSEETPDTLSGQGK